MTASTTISAEAGLPVGRRPWGPTLLAVGTVVALMDILRVLFPSISFIYGRAGSTPATQLGLFAFLVFAAAGICARLAGINATRSAPLALLGTVVARLVLVAAPGGASQLVASSIGFVAVVSLLGALAGSDLPARETSRGLSLGLLASLSLHLLLGTRDAIWLGGAIGWLLTFGVIATLAIGWNASRPSNARPQVRTAIPWLLFGPIIA
ncbi:MAG: hypothetical protein ACI867_000913, partial [Glaciecola sp.]